MLTWAICTAAIKCKWSFDDGLAVLILLAMVADACMIVGIVAMVTDYHLESGW